MKIYKKVRGSASSVPHREVNVDTVYTRFNIKRIEEEDFVGWEYDEIQTPKDQHLGQLALQEDLDGVAELTVATMIDNDEIAGMLVYALQKIDELEERLND